MITRRDFIHDTAASALLSLIPKYARASEPPPPRDHSPNVLFIIVDDLCCHLGCYGNATVKSPNIDRLAARGVRFERNYCQYPLCNPSRSSVLTSLRPEKSGILTNLPGDSIRRRVPDAIMLPQFFREHGYYTSSQGKISHTGVDDQGRPALEQDRKSWVSRTEIWGS